MQDNEVWAKIQHPVLKDYYYASSTGRVKSARPGRSDKILKQSKIYNGYLIVNLSRIDGDNRPFFVHRAVLIAFLGLPPLGKGTVNHKNGVKSDNFIENLEWVSLSENRQHAIQTGLMRTGWNGGDANNQTKIVQKRNGVIIKKYNSQSEAARENKIEQSGINHCLKGRCKKYKGCKWEYA